MEPPEPEHTAKPSTTAGAALVAKAADICKAMDNEVNKPAKSLEHSQVQHQAQEEHEG